MTDETVDCFNCGRANPEWAQVCRSCGVALRHGEDRVVPAGRYPTDRDSLISIGSVIGTIFVALLIGLFVSSLNPTDPTVGLGGTPSSSPSPSVSVAPSVSASIAPSVAPTPSPTPALPGTLAFGTTVGGDGLVTDPTDTFTPAMAFAYSVSLPNGIGATTIENEIAKIDGETETIVLPRQAVTVDPAATSFGFVIGSARDFLGPWGPGSFEWRVYVNDQVVARGPFTFAEG